jgi:hypothetical protein
MCAELESRGVRFDVATTTIEKAEPLTSKVAR